MSGAAGARETDQFATLLRELKDRSGLSYGGLAKRLHLSTSTLHRYCNGTAVPNEYAPVERLARACRATPQELVELHRRWVLADEARRLRGDQAAAARAEAAAAGSGEVGGAGAAAGLAPDPAAGPAAAADSPWAPNPARGAGSTDPAAGAGSRHPASAESAAEPAPTAALPAQDTDGVAAGPEDPENPENPENPDEPVVVNLPRGSASPRRRRTTLITSAAVAAVLATTVLVAHPWDRAGNDAGDQQAAGATASSNTADAKAPSSTPSPTGTRHTPSASASTTGSAGTSVAPQGGPKQSTTATPGGGTDNTVPIAVATRPYVYDSPCSQHFLVDSSPAYVGPPATEQDAPRWAGAYRAVSSNEQRVALTVQGTGTKTVVLQALHVRAISTDAPLAWNDFSMGVGCGGGVDTKSFDIDLDNGSPSVTVKNGQRDFPYKVSESDPEVFYVTAHTKAHDVRWDLTLDWSSGNRHGTVHIDNNGVPFRTSANVDRPGYDYPLGGSEWIKRDS